MNAKGLLRKSTRKVRRKFPHAEKPHKCDICGEGFNARTTLHKHKKGHTDTLHLKCKLCGAGFTGEGQIKTHMWTHVIVNYKPHKCGQCDMSFTVRRGLQEHRLKFHTSNKLEDSESSDDDSDTEHVQNIQTSGNKESGDQPRVLPFKCSACEIEFGLRGTLLRHMLKMHMGGSEFDKDYIKVDSGERPYKCGICNKTFKQKRILRSHKRIHTGIRPYKCDMCTMTFVRRDSLVQHRRIHTGEKPYKCKDCDKSYPSLCGLKFHMMSHTGEMPHKCDLCNKPFSRKRYYDKHMNMHKEKPFMCKICERGFAQEEDYNKHMENHTLSRGFFCEECGKGFYKRANLKKHLLNIHRGRKKGQKPYQCGVCGEVYGDLSNLKIHMRVHTGGDQSELMVLKLYKSENEDCLTFDTMKENSWFKQYLNPL